MNSLVVAGQGVGNIIMATPLIRALKVWGHNTHFYLQCNFTGWDEAFNHPKYVDRLNGDLDKRYDYIFETWWAEPYWTTDIECDERYDGRPDSHELRSNLLLANKAGMPIEAVKQHIRPFINHSDTNYLEGNKVIGIHAGCNPGPLWEGKKWKSYQALINKLKLNGYKIAGFGSYHDQKLLNVDYDFYGALSGTELVNAIAECALFISNDTGPMHIAAALNVPQIAIVGGEGYKRWHKNDICVYANNATILADFDLTKITINKVIEIIHEKI